MRYLKQMSWTAILLCMWLTSANAQQASVAKYPVKPVRFIVGFAPGGAVDVQARVIAQRMSESLGQSVIVENRAGADGILASDFVAKSPADGYVFGYVSAGHAMNSILHAKTLPYHAINDFSPVSLVASGPLTLVVNRSFPVNSLKQLVALAKAQPGKLNFASSGSGGTMHLAGELLKSVAQVDIVHVPYKGGGPALTDVISGQIELTFVGAPASMPHIRSGRLKVLAVTSARRSLALPEVPTVAELGYPGYELGAWYGLLGPARMQPGHVNQMSAELAKTVALADTRDKLLALGIEPVGSTPERFAEHLRSEIARWTPIIAKAGIKPD
jgi:tripartite-type tricarboxylate transporter receptor subunit TctC